MDWTRRGLTHWTYRNGGPGGAHMETFSHANGLGSDLVGALARDSAGNLWVATFAGCRDCAAAQLQTIRLQTDSQAT